VIAFVGMFNPLLFPLLSGWLLAVFIVVTIWDLIWRGVALWKAAGNKSKGWFVCLLIFNTAGILPIIYILFFADKKKKKRK